ncbi:MAG TPA: hypothetical protein VFB79_04860 [Candidatus Angelobacter sp.]|nr:hypothetical protein [Candidatus Angelobacter sp.]
MRIFPAILLTILLSVKSYAAKEAHELWTMPLSYEGSIQRFDRQIKSIWMGQEGVVFISPERLAIYQVNRVAKPAPLAKRDASGGSGNYFLVVKILDAHSGQPIKEMQFPTSADYSSVVPTHDGKFLVRAGNALGLFSSDFKLLGSRELPTGHVTVIDYTEVKVTPSGKHIAIIHQQRELDVEAIRQGKPSKIDTSEADLEILDADTMQSLHKLHLPGYLASWAPDDKSLISSEPGKPVMEAHMGILDFDGHWTAINYPFKQSYKQCYYNVQPLEHDRMAAFGCGNQYIFGEPGQKPVPLPEIDGDNPISMLGAADYLALENKSLILSGVGKYRMEPSHILVFDVRTGERTMVAKLKTIKAMYTVSKEGMLAVVDSDVLRVFDGKE